MKLNEKALKDRAVWEAGGFILPAFDRERVKEETRDNPEWVHFGCGNLFRAFPAVLQQRLLDEGWAKTGIIVAEGYDYEIVENAVRPQDNLCLAVTLKPDGTIEKRVVASIVESLTADSGNTADFGRLKEIFRSRSLQMASFTITEKGYGLTDGKGELLPDVRADFAAGPVAPRSYMGKVAALCYERYLNGRLPLALVSMDNCSHNGTRLYEAVSAFARAWVEKGLAEEEFEAYIRSGAVSFPWTMIDKITPRPDESVKQMLTDAGFEDVEPVVTSKNTYVAPFVNAEEPEYLVIEDAFPNGRPPLEKAGVMFADRETVDRVEKMKVCTCLNPLHTALAVFGCLLGYTRIYQEMEDPQLKKLVEIVGYREGLPVVTDPGIIRPADFLKEVLEVRMPNPFMPDAPQRIACDTSQKLAVRFGKTINAYQDRADLSTEDLQMIPLVLAGWCRYLMGVDDEGMEFRLSPDPMLAELRPVVQGIRLGDQGPFDEALKPLLSNRKIFGADLYADGLAGRVARYFGELAAGPGAVRKTLKRHVGEP
ncbi:MAG: mannitol dehydrogenase family protein [Lachnospiraceae bacterium]|nr:mannitol dehydrogenase family protein [Lachnospiraceae bacterium]